MREKHVRKNVLKTHYFLFEEVFITQCLIANFATIVVYGSQRITQEMGNT